MRKILTITLLSLLLLGSAAFLLLKPDGDPEIRAEISVSKALSNDDTSGYLRAINPRKFIFPSDHGPHLGFKTEWWYFTGNLKTENGNHFGYQFTIFRTALSPGNLSSESKWRTNQVYMGHFTLTDVSNEKFYSFERFSRGSEGLAGAAAEPFKIWLEDWKVEGIPVTEVNELPVIKLKASENNITVDFTIRNLKPLVLQGNKGLSQKSSKKGNASYYYSATRMETNGTIRIAGEKISVKGLSWMDREWSTSALDKNQEGWDWFSLQLNDGREIMYYQMRNKDGTIDTFSNGTIIYADGSKKALKSIEVELIASGNWESPRGGSYPSGWILRIPRENLDLEISPYVKDQELNVSILYWEGAVKVRSKSDNNLNGNGYVELTGYGQVL